jgi:hypothetical protein
VCRYGSDRLGRTGFLPWQSSTVDLAAPTLWAAGEVCSVLAQDWQHLLFNCGPRRLVDRV